MQAFSDFDLHSLPEVVVELTQLFFRFNLLGDIGIGPKPVNDITGFVANGKSARQEPAVVTVVTAQRKRIFPRLTSLEALSYALNNAINMVGMMHFLPTPALHLFKRRSCVVVPAFVVPISPTPSISRPRKLANIVGQFAKAYLAFTQCLLR